MPETPHVAEERRSDIVEHDGRLFRKYFYRITGVRSLQDAELALARRRIHKDCPMAMCLRDGTYLVMPCLDMSVSERRVGLFRRRAYTATATYSMAAEAVGRFTKDGSPIKAAWNG